jgi:hypothetical protein
LGLVAERGAKARRRPFVSNDNDPATEVVTRPDE